MVFFFSLFWTSMSTKLWGFSCFLIRNMFGLLVVYFTHLAPHVHFSYFVHALHIATSCTHLCYPYHSLVYILFPHPQHVMFYFMLCCIVFLKCFVFCLSFFFSLILHPSCIIIIVCSFISCLCFSLTLCLLVTKKGRVYSREYPGEFCYFYITLVHILRGRNSISCALLQGERYSIGEIRIPKGR